MFEYKVTRDGASLPGLTTRFDLRCDERVPELIQAWLGREGIESELLPGSAGWTASLDIAPVDFERVNRLVWTLETARDLEPRPEAGIAGGWALSRYKQGAPKRGGRDWPNTKIGDLISAVKYPSSGNSRSRSAAAHEIETRMADFVRFNPACARVDAVVWAYSSQQLTGSLGQAVAEALGIPGVGASLMTNRTIPKAKGLAASQAGLRVRPEELALGPAPLPGSRVLLIDDVWTTGKTLEAHAAACREQWGSIELWAVVAARTHRSGR